MRSNKPKTVVKTSKAKSISTTQPPTKAKPSQNCFGMEKWVNEYNEKVLNMEKLKEDNLKYLNNYQRREEDAKRREKAGADDDGWITVTKKGRNPGLSRKESVDSKLSTKTMEMKGLSNFYRFQMKESKMKHMENLKKQFEADKLKVDALRQTRRFKPY